MYIFLSKRLLLVLSKNIRLATAIMVMIFPAKALCDFSNSLEKNSPGAFVHERLTQEEKRWLMSHKVIRVGVKNNWKPIEFVTQQKKFRGITIDYLNTIAPMLNVRFEMVDIDENPTEEIDLLSSVSSFTFPGHEKYVFTKPILQFKHAIYVHKSLPSIHNMEDLLRKKTAVFKHGQLLNLLEVNFPTINLVKIDMVEEAFNDIAAKKSDAYIGNEMVVDYEANLQGINFLKKTGYAPIKTELKMAVRKDWPLLASILNKSFTSLQPEQDNILANWNLSVFKKDNIYTSIFTALFLLLMGYMLYKAYKFKQIIAKQKLDAQKQIWHQAHYDSQTGLANRNLFNLQIAEEIKYAEENKIQIGLLYIDIDLFKNINDQHGHSIGDLLLTKVARRISGCVRSSDKVARLAGDEFAIILSDISDIEAIENTALRVLTSLQKPFQVNNLALNITSSIGSTIYPNNSIDVETTIKNADMAMYEAKKQGKNCYRPFTKSMQDLTTHRHTVSNDLKIAIKEGQFRLYYQPIVALETNKVVRAEALIRWQHPEKGLIGPYDFIEIAEESNIISKIGHWVFEQAIEDTLKLQKIINADFSVSINVSPKQLGQESMLLRWPAILKEQNMPLNSIGIEITEGLLLERNKLTRELLSGLRNAGAQILIDDFGTGYSSLSYLKQLDVDFIKIDRSFIKNLSITSEDMVLCEAIIVMAHKLGLKVIAEGIETLEQSELLLQMGCDYGQGYLFSKPKPLKQLISNNKPIK